MQIYLGKFIDNIEKAHDFSAAKSAITNKICEYTYLKRYFVDNNGQLKLSIYYSANNPAKAAFIAPDVIMLDVSEAGKDGQLKIGEEWYIKKQLSISEKDWFIDEAGELGLQKIGITDKNLKKANEKIIEKVWGGEY